MNKLQTPQTECRKRIEKTRILPGLATELSDLTAKNYSIFLTKKHNDIVFYKKICYNVLTNSKS